LKKILSLSLTFFSALLYFSNACSSQPTTFLGPTVKSGYTAAITNTTAYSVSGEVGVKNYRIAGTLGWKIWDEQRLKISGEYLWQKMTYNFFAGNTQQWVNQGAVGADYEYDLLGYAFKPRFNLQGYYSHAPSKNLNTVSGAFVNNSGILQNFIDTRRIAGSNAGGVAPGITIQPWQGAKAGVDLNYDCVSYDKRGVPSEDAKGFGGTARFDQALTRDVDLGLVAGMRQPFNNYQANLNWTKDSSVGELVLGLGAAYTVGKNTLPSSYNVIASVKFLIDQRAPVTRHPNLKSDYKNEALPPLSVSDGFKKWTSDPAVYMPQVLTVQDQSILITTPPPSCALIIPSLLSVIANQGTFTVDSTFPVAPNFGGDNLTYSITPITPFIGSTVTINSATGVVSVHIVHGPVTVSGTFTVTATNCLGAITSNIFTITLN